MRMIALLFVLAFAPICYFPQDLAKTVNPQEPTTKATYLVIYRPGPAWVTGKSVMEQPLQEHGKYMLSLYMKGSMKLAGPFADNAGGAVFVGSFRRGRGEGDSDERYCSRVRDLCIRNASLETAAMG
jgi:hypothetical protein